MSLSSIHRTPDFGRDLFFKGDLVAHNVLFGRKRLGIDLSVVAQEAVRELWTMFFGRKNVLSS